MKGVRGVPLTRRVLTRQLDNAFQGSSKRANKTSPVKISSKRQYVKRVIQRFNDMKNDAEDQQKRSTTSYKRGKQACPRSSWVMFHKIYEMIRCIHKSEIEHNKQTSKQIDEIRRHKHTYCDVDFM